MHVLKRSRACVLSAVCGLTLLVACSHKNETFTTHVEISRTQVVTTGAARAVDVELEYSDCPGEQREIFQADATFADCLTQYKIGEKVEAQIIWQQMPDGHFDSEVDKVGTCPRKRDAQDERSYEIVHECHDIIVNGMNIGFHCDRKPTPELLSKCPWFRRT
jgi:hypothetical protein